MLFFANPYSDEQSHQSLCCHLFGGCTQEESETFHWLHIQECGFQTKAIYGFPEIFQVSAETHELIYLPKPSVLSRQDADHEVRVEEAITRMLVCAIKSAENPSDGDLWLNPTEVSSLLSHYSSNNKELLTFCLAPPESLCCFEKKNFKFHPFM